MPFYCGTGSHAGKSVLAAGLCRILKQDGFKPAPFRSQNMALNSFVTEDGAQVIVMGKPIGDMEARDYDSYKAKIFETAKQAFKRLSAQYDVVVMEGAGSPAEINIKDDRGKNRYTCAGSNALYPGPANR